MRDIENCAPSILLRNRGPSGKLRDSAGNLLRIKPERMKGCREYFESLLNDPAKVSSALLDHIAELPIQAELAQLPYCTEVLDAVQRLPRSSAPCPDGIQAEVLRALDATNMRALHEMTCRAWDLG